MGGAHNTAIGAGRTTILVPFLWLVAFFLVPFLIVLRISLSQTELAQPPYSPVFDLATGWQGLKDFVAALSLDNFRLLASDALYVFSYLKSIEVAAVSTSVLLVIGFSFAYGMARAPRRLQALLVVLVVLPFWTAFLVRIYAWINILQREGLLNEALVALGVVREPVGWLASDTAVYIGIVYTYLPFMVLPIYAAVERYDFKLSEAAADLYADRWTTLRLVLLPAVMPGIVAGCILVFVPSLGAFLAPDLLGGAKNFMIGSLIEEQFKGAAGHWPFGAACAMILLTMVLLALMVYARQQARANAGARR